MPHPAAAVIERELTAIPLVDPHTHINPHAPAAETLADLLGYHYYTELAHSAGMPKDQIEDPDLSPRELVGRLIKNLGPLTNTAQYSWLIEICQSHFGLRDELLDPSNWETVYEAAERKMRTVEWPAAVLQDSNVEAVFLTNDFDDPLAGFDTNIYIPCLRTDDLVFHLAKPEVRERLEACSDISPDDSVADLRRALRQRFEHFTAAGARACAISLPPTFSPRRVSDTRAETALIEIASKGILVSQSNREAMARFVFWTIAELCDEFGLPFDLMIGVNRSVYAAGVYQGQDLYDSRVSLLQYRELFNAFPDVKFPISVLASVTNQELVSHAWIFPNVIASGHWWYSNTPSFITRDLTARLEAIPQNKIVGYYSDAYKLEFVAPKFGMYRRILAQVLADQFVDGCGWSEHRAIELGRRVLRGNVDEIFPSPESPPATVDESPDDDATIVMEPEEKVSDEWKSTAASATLAAGAIGVAPVDEPDDPESLLADLDPSPGADEVGQLPLGDDELVDGQGEPYDADTIEIDLDDESLDVGDLSASQDDAPQIRPLRDETGFQPDADDVKLTPDPRTGELRFPAPKDQDER